MSDCHIRILHHIARQTQRELEHHNTIEAAGDAASTGRRDCLVPAQRAHVRPSRTPS
jgi:hypothetical protein